MEAPSDSVPEDDFLPILDGNGQVDIKPDANALAEELQLQEVIIFYINSGRTCAVCEEVTPSPEALTMASCGHGFCTECHSAAVDMETAGCPIANCKGALRPKALVTEETGESSAAGARRSRLEFYCGVCMETVPATERFAVAPCDHSYCRSCTSQYISAKVEENVVSIVCLDPTCKDGALEPESCREILPTDVLERWGAALCEAALGVKRFYCPFRDCSALVVNDGGDVGEALTDAQCPHCERLCCAQCEAPWHEGILCEEFQKLGVDERGRDDLMLRKVAAESKWQRCPQCRIYVERTEGCVFMICRCGYCFCYLCASPMSKDNHNCQQCMRTW